LLLFRFSACCFLLLIDFMLAAFPFFCLLLSPSHILFNSSWLICLSLWLMP
jgi:hypothetical protein